jgi:hypothetical protein
MFQQFFQLFVQNLTISQLIHTCVFFFIVFYAFIVKLFGITGFKQPIQITFLKILEIIGKSVLVAVVEEIIFRVLLFYIFFQNILNLNYTNAMIFTCLIFAASHFYLIGVHVHALHKVELFIGLFLFGMIMCKNFPVGNIVFHMFAILGVETTNLIFKQEKPQHWWVWDESHALIRSPILWIALSLYYVFV